MKIFATLASLIIFAGFIALSVRKFGWKDSYSAYAQLWKKAVPIHNLNVWSLVTVIVAFLLVPAMLEAGDESPLQFLGFFAPIYLAVVAFTPDWDINPEDEKNEADRLNHKRQRIIHKVGAALCATATVCWLIFALRLWFLIPITLVATGLAAYFTKTYKNYVFWLEMAMFAAVYIAALV